MRTTSTLVRRVFCTHLGVAFLGLLAASRGPGETPWKSYRLPAGDASATLRLFSEQSGEQVVFPVDRVRGVRTNAVEGELPARLALERMLAGTSLRVVEDERSGALAVRREDGTDSPRPAPKPEQ